MATRPSANLSEHVPLVVSAESHIITGGSQPYLRPVGAHAARQITREGRAFDVMPGGDVPLVRVRTAQGHVITIAAESFAHFPTVEGRVVLWSLPHPAMIDVPPVDDLLNRTAGTPQQQLEAEQGFISGMIVGNGMLSNNQSRPPLVMFEETSKKTLATVSMILDRYDYLRKVKNHTQLRVYLERQGRWTVIRSRRFETAAGNFVVPLRDMNGEPHEWPAAARKAFYAGVIAAAGPSQDGRGIVIQNVDDAITERLATALFYDAAMPCKVTWRGHRAESEKRPSRAVYNYIEIGPRALDRAETFGMTVEVPAPGRLPAQASVTDITDTVVSVTPAGTGPAVVLHTDDDLPISVNGFLMRSRVSRERVEAVTDFAATKEFFA